LTLVGGVFLFNSFTFEFFLNLTLAGYVICDKVVHQIIIGVCGFLSPSQRSEAYLPDKCGTLQFLSFVSGL
jgi:hypothetical protein